MHKAWQAVGKAAALCLCVWIGTSPARAERPALGTPVPPAREAGAAGRNAFDQRGLDRSQREVLGTLAPFLAAEHWNGLSRKRRGELLAYARVRIDRRDPYAICWAPGASDDLVAAFHAVEEAVPAGRNGRPDEPAAATQLGSRWSNTATNGSGQNVQGLPITLTWSLVRDGTPIPAAFPDESSDPSNLRSWLVGLYGGDVSKPPEDPVNAAWFSIFEDMFASYAAKTGMRYVYEPSDDGATLSSANGGILGTRGDIRIAAHRIDGDPAPGESTTLAYNYFPSFGDMVIDSEDSSFDDLAQDSRVLRNTIEHEHGHGLGLEHVCPLDRTKLMEPSIALNFLGLQFDDIYGVQRLYGDPLEVHGGNRDNDTVGGAVPIPLAGGTPFDFQWLSIDDSSDQDVFQFEASAGSIVTVRVVPGNGTYLEGGQQANGNCAAGINFASSEQHDLVLELLGPGGTVLATSNTTGLGGTEEILDATVGETGPHFIRVTGGSSDSAQLYRLESQLVLPGVALLVQAGTIVQESLQPGNGMVDPGETVSYRIEVRNAGAVPATNVVGTVTGAEGFTGFQSVYGYGDLASSASAAGEFVFALEGALGDTLPVDLTLTADGGVSQRTPLAFTLGAPLLALNESFDESGSVLPAGWASAVVDNGGGWSVVATDSFSPPFAVFAENVSTKGLSTLTSPEVSLTGDPAVLRFQHRYNTEANFDGGVLEVSVNGGEWLDIEQAGGVFQEGGYVLQLPKGQQNLLPDRMAWSGNSGGWLRTTVQLPPGMQNSPVRFRWMLGSDRTAGGEGWFIDEVVVDTGSFVSSGLPVVELGVVDGVASEADGADTAEVRVRTPLPLVRSLPVPLRVGGTAVLGSDVLVEGFETVEIPAGETEVSLVVSAVRDGVVEGPETFTLAVDDSAPLVAGGSGPAALVIEDSAYGQWAFANLGLVAGNGPGDDFDGDLADNLSEFAWGTDGTSFRSFPVLHARGEGGLLRIDVPAGPLPVGVTMVPEESHDLQNWTPAVLQPVPGGFTTPVPGRNYFLRLRFEVLP